MRPLESSIVGEMLLADTSIDNMGVVTASFQIIINSGDLTSEEINRPAVLCLS